MQHVLDVPKRRGRPTNYDAIFAFFAINITTSYWWRIQGASLNRANLQHCLFLISQHWGVWRYRHFAANFKAFLQKRWHFCDRSAWISKRVRDSSQSCCSISPCRQERRKVFPTRWSYEPHRFHEQLWGVCFLTMLSPVMGTSHEQPGHPIIQHEVSFSGVIWNLKSSKLQHPTQFRSWKIDFSKKSHEFLWYVSKSNGWCSQELPSA